MIRKANAVRMPATGGHPLLPGASVDGEGPRDQLADKIVDDRHVQHDGNTALIRSVRKTRSLEPSSAWLAGLPPTGLTCSGGSLPMVSQRSLAPSIDESVVASGQSPTERFCPCFRCRMTGPEPTQTDRGALPGVLPSEIA